MRGSVARKIRKLHAELAAQSEKTPDRHSYRRLKALLRAIRRGERPKPPNAASKNQVVRM